MSEEQGAVVEEDVKTGVEAAGEVENNDPVESTGSAESEKIFENLTAMAEGKKPEEMVSTKVEGELPEDRAGLEKIPKQAHENVVKERIRLRQERAKIAQEKAEWERQRAAPKQPEEGQERTEQPKTPQAPVKIKPQDVAFIFDAARRAKSVLAGGFDEKIDEEKAKEIVTAFNALRVELNDPRELLELRDAVLAGKLPGGSEVAQLLEAELPFVQQRSNVRSENERRVQEQAQSVQKRVEGAFEKVFTAYPEFKPPVDMDPAKMTPEVKFAIEYMQKEVDEDDKKRIQADPEKALTRLFTNIKNAWVAKNAGVVRAEKEILQKKIQKGTGPLPGGKPTGGADASVPESEKTWARLQEMAGGSAD